MSPDLLLPKVMRRIGLDLPAVRRAELLADPKAKNPQRHARLLQMLDGMVRGAGGEPLALAGAEILEIGCGRLGGLSAAATVLDAAGYLGVDPGFDPGIFAHPSVQERYLARALSETAALFGVREDLTALRRRFGERCRFHQGALDSLPDGTGAGLVLSISCLEHIHPLRGSLARLHDAVAPGARHVHLVNFANHTDKAAPFAGIYETTPERYRTRFGGHINLLRPSDVLAAFAAAGFAARLVPQDVRPEQLPATIHSWWAEHYDRETLAVRTALILVG